MNIFYEKFANTSKNNRQKENLNLKMFSLFLASTKPKEDIPPPGAGLKHVCKTFLFAHFRVTVKIFRGHAPS